MAIVKAPALSLDASGNLGGINYTRWRGRAIARSSWSPTIPNTTLQVVIQGYLSTAVTNWGTILTQANRDAWNEYAARQVVVDRLGIERAPSGYNLYISRQIQSLRASGPVLFEPPGILPQVMPTDFVMQQRANPGQIRMRFTGYQTTERADRVEYGVSMPYDTEARNPTSEEWRFVGFVTGTGFKNFNGVAGKWYWGRGRMYWLDGRVTNWWTGQIQAPS